MYYRKLDASTHSGHFMGYASPENNQHDQFAVAIYNDDNEQLGWIPKNNYKLHRSIIEWDDSRALAFGKLGYRDEWYGYVYILVGLDEDTQGLIIDLVHNSIELSSLMKTKDKDVDIYKRIFNLDIKISESNKSYNCTEFINVEVGKSIISSGSRKFEQNSLWGELILLESYGKLIETMSDRNRLAVLKRIERAKLELIK
tara:strand:- start:277 stop:876 length:600 start_codon:yes stop_codon:yes gene_type:complete